MSATDAASARAFVTNQPHQAVRSDIIIVELTWADNATEPDEYIPIAGYNLVSFFMDSNWVTADMSILAGPTVPSDTPDDWYGSSDIGDLYDSNANQIQIAGADMDTMLGSWVSFVGDAAMAIAACHAIGFQSSAAQTSGPLTMKVKLKT